MDYELPPLLCATNRLRFSEDNIQCMLSHTHS
eukprot:SAG22_NODE_14023_length_387_cov_1.083333_1_plen_31_part_10